MPRRPIVPKHEDWRGKTLRVVWSKKADPKPEHAGNQPHPDVKFTCQCGYSSTATPDHKCPDHVWQAGGPK
jgi:hypothetical protein